MSELNFTIAPSQIKDLTSRTFERLKVIEFAGLNKYGQATWLCDCQCGNRKVVAGYRLKGRHTKSCGCLQPETARRMKYIHGGSYTPEYDAWKAMIQRCTNVKNPSYFRYGARGITVCTAWRKSFQRFLEDMGPRPSPQHTLERVDNSAGYSPENCIWATHSEQARNTRHNRRITFRGQSRSVGEWAEVVGIRAGTISWRIRSGWSILRALTEPVRR